VTELKLREVKKRLIN